ncbi:MAG TPA: nicotinate (nicotinamide) nucleotide adenylyltransferase [Terracidiphilus sp.]|jgi:nicotinate-nucleotide adenylyltransferase|nr:nicotinate (nicotinamide) nucleotide adenylyltransferase [Terracidiphilus sp.]
MDQDSHKRIAFFGGSFDPPHLGHLAVARAARDALRLDTVLFAPVGAQPLKPQGSAATFADRVAMTELAIDGERGFAVSQIDAPDAEGRPNYTLATLRRLHAEIPSATLFCLMGADSFLSLRHWHGAAEVPFAASMVVASRPGQDIGALAAALPTGIALEPAQNSPASADPRIELRAGTLRNASGKTAAFYVLPGLDVEISASETRAQLRAAISPADSRQLVPTAVERYIHDHALYR